MTAHAPALQRYSVWVESDTDQHAPFARWVTYDWGDTYDEAARALAVALAEARDHARHPISYGITENA